LPPGLAPPTLENNFIIAGTPTEPGDWDVTLALRDYYCGVSSTGQHYGDRDVHIHFHIDGDAPRSVDSLP